MAISPMRESSSVIYTLYLNCLRRFRTFISSLLIAFLFVNCVPSLLSLEQRSPSNSYDNRITNRIYNEIGNSDSGRSYEFRDTIQSCYDLNRKAQRCEPRFENAAYQRHIEATSTCGTPTTTRYCIQAGYQQSNPKSGTCDDCYANQHPAAYMTDFHDNKTRTYWQSQTMFDGIGEKDSPNEYVNITLDLGKAFDITYVRLKFESPRPHSLAIYKKINDSADSQWIPFQYYSSACYEIFKVDVTLSAPAEDETKALCTPEYSEISPLSGGNVIFTTLEGRPSKDIFEKSSVLQEFVTATKILISLKKFNTFGDDVFKDPHVLRSYYYAISDIAVGGRCKCNGHANRCIPDRESGRLRCECQHHTAGVDCEICAPMFNDQEWQVATSEDAHECKPCNCNGKADRCVFDRDLYERTGHGGHCIDCRDNSDGDNCERCKPNFYQNSRGECVPCNCNPEGSESLQCNSQGKCLCKPGVGGQFCDRCAPNHYDLSLLGCKSCDCNVNGSVGIGGDCDPYYGKCRCKKNVEGQKCELCKPGFFDLQGENEYGCLPCFCSGHSTVCTSSHDYSKYSIDTSFTSSAEEWTARDSSGREVLTIPMNGALGVRAERDETIYFVASERYRGDKRGSYNQYLTFTLRIGEDHVRSTFEDVIIKGKGLSISQPIFGQGNKLPNTRPQVYRFKLHDDISYGWSPRLSSKEFISILSDVVSIEIRGNYAQRGSGYLEDVKLDSVQLNPYGIKATWIEHCECPTGYVGQFCETCAKGWRREPPNGGSLAPCVPCNCHGHADDCDSETGICICQHNTDGENCERCAVGFYGKAVIGTPNDCKPCQCPEINGEIGACVQLNDNTTACLRCPDGYTGFQCDLCVDGYYGDPEGKFGTPQPCRKCECNDNVDQNAVGNCDSVTGECLKCVYNTFGRHCEKCSPGFYGDATTVPKGNCKSCDCHPRGTKLFDMKGNSRGANIALSCNQTTGQCDCHDHVIGRQCDQCLDSYWNIDSGNDCEPCNCDKDGSESRNCDIKTGKCKCKPGVTGDKCDQCLPRHYGFSAKGCQECHCDEVGSTSLQCDARGQCPCQRNIEGRRCERCRENMYNMSAGCIDCPPCYNLVQDAVTAHRSKLGELTKMIEDIENNPSVVEDQSFESQLREVQRKVEDLLRDAKRAQGADGTLTNQLEQLNARIEKVREISNQIRSRLHPLEVAVNHGKSNVTFAEELIERAQGALNNARKLLENEGLYALNKARERSKKWGLQSDRMYEIAKLASALADKHENEAQTIHGVIMDALNTSRRAHDLAQEAINAQETNRRQIEMLHSQFEMTNELMHRTKKMADEAKKVAQKASDDAIDVTTALDSFNASLLRFEADKIKMEAMDLIKQAKSIANEADDLMNRFADLLNSTKTQLRDANDLLEEANRQQQILEAMLGDVDLAMTVADDAVKAGDATLKDANKTLATLKEFDSVVKESRDKALEAMKRVANITRLINEAEEKTNEAETALHGALKDALEALEVALTAQQIAEKASHDTKRIQEEASTTKDKASKLKKQAQDLNTAVGETSERMKGYEEQAENDEKLANDALERANQAKTSTMDAQRKVANASKTVDEILDSLANLDDIDMRQLDELERKLRIAEEELLRANLDNRTNELKLEKDRQFERMRNYDEEIAKLTADVKNIREITDAIPKECHKGLKLEP